MKTLRKVLGGAAAAALLAGGASVAFAQTYSNPDGSGSVVPNSGTTNTSGNTNTNTGTTSSTSTSDTGGGAVLGATSTDPNVPNTGAGGDTAAMLSILTVSGLAAVAGATYLMRKRMAL